MEFARLKQQRLDMPSDFNYSATKNGAIDGAPCGRRQNTVEGCRSIDVLEWHRRGFSDRRGDSRGAGPGMASGASINVETQRRVGVEWTSCRLGGERPWFVCSVAEGVYCGRRVSKLYGAGRLIVCRHRAVNRSASGLPDVEQDPDQGHADADVPDPPVRRNTRNSPVGTNCAILGSGPNEPGGCH